MAQLPTDPMAAMQEFFTAGDSIVGHMKKAALLSRTEEDRAMFAGMLGEIDTQRRELEATLPGVFQDAKGRLDGALTRLEKLRAKKDELLAKAESLTTRMDQQIQSARETIKKEAAKPKPEVPRPKFRRPEKSAPLELTPGDDLRDWLIPPPAATEPTVPRTHGNIWDNWRIAARQEPATSEELGNQKDREDEEPE